MSWLDALEDLNRPQIDPKPWMKEKVLELVTDETKLQEVVDSCIQSQIFSLDLETTGLDNRVFYGDDGTPYTMDKIVGYCLSPDGHHGYYIPVRHVDNQGNRHEANLSPGTVAEELRRLIATGAKAIFHNAKFDQEFLQFAEGKPIGEWDDPEVWEDTLILAYLRNTRERSKGLKHLAQQELGMEMIELDELFSAEQKKQLGKGNLNFSLLDPSWEPCIWYAASDAICTFLLYAGTQKQGGDFPGLYEQVMDPKPHGQSQKVIYKLEKLCLPSTRWMERNRVYIDRDKVRELIILGQKEWFDSLIEVYTEAEKLLHRPLRPGWLRIMQGDEGAPPYDPTQIQPTYMECREEALREAARRRLDPTEAGADGKERVESIAKEVPSLTNPKKKEQVSFTRIYDVTIPSEFGLLLRELGVKGLEVTAKSGQVKTSKDVLEKLLENQAEDFPFMAKVSRFREVAKALGSNLFPILKDTDPKNAPDSCLKVSFNGHKVDTGRFATPTPRDKKRFHGQSRWNLHSIPATYDTTKPACMLRIREAVRARPEHLLFAVDFSGVELRIVTNLSREPKWLAEFFHCSNCDHTFDAGDGRETPEAPPPFCPKCGSDKIGDLHTLTALSVYGEGIKGTPQFKQKRQNAKGLNFAMCYGGGPSAAQRAVGVDRDEGFRIKRQFDKSYGGLTAWWRQQHAFARKYKYVTTLFGRRYPLPDIDHEMGGFRSKAERNAVNGPVQGCLHPDVRIPTSQGMVPVRDLYQDAQDFMVWTGQGWKEARPLYSGEKPVRVTEFSPGTTIKTSPEHLFLTWRDQTDSPQGRGDVLEWVRQQNLGEGDWVAMSTEALDWGEPQYKWTSETQPQEGHLFSKGMTPHNYKGFAINGNSEAMWEFLGLVYGDGSIGPDKFVLHVGEPSIEGYTGPPAEEIARTYMEKINGNLDVGAVIYRKQRPEAESHKKEIWQVKVHNKAFRDFCRDTLGVQDQNTYTKRFPTALWKESVKNRAAFLRGYFSSDGHVSASGDAVSVRSVNRGLLRDTHDLLRSIGIRSSYREKSLRVSVLDRNKYASMVGFTLPYKTSRLASRNKNPWENQWDTAPPNLVRWVGRVVRSSSMYADLPREEKSAVLRLVAGSGSRHQCQQYLDKLCESEVPESLVDLLRYDWEQVVSFTDTNETVEMYDVEVFDDFHAFVADGCVVHNTSADITKLAMALIYKECKDRGWLDLVKMTITIHDELVFEIHKSIVEEAVEMICHIMTKNKFMMRMRCPIPLKVDTEFGQDWTVPYNLTEMAYNQSKKPWTPEFARLFPKSYANYLKCGGEPVEGSPNIPQDTPTPATSTPADKAVEIASQSKAQFQPPKADPKRPYRHVIHSSKLSYGVMEKLAHLIMQCEGRGTQPLHLVTENGDALLPLETPILVSAVEFKILAEQQGL